MICVSFSFENVADDEDYMKWKKKWKKMKKQNTSANANATEKKMALTQEFLRMFLSKDLHSQFYFSFCNEDIEEDGWTCHCINCQKCEDWRLWHCGKCDRCKYTLLKEHVKNMLSLLKTSKIL